MARYSSCTVYQGNMPHEGATFSSLEDCLGLRTNYNYDYVFVMI
jgi:hypothetical protein